MSADLTRRDFLRRAEALALLPLLNRAYAGVSPARLADDEDFWEKIRAAYVPPSSGTEASNAEV